MMKILKKVPVVSDRIKTSNFDCEKCYNFD